MIGPGRRRAGRLTRLLTGVILASAASACGGSAAPPRSGVLGVSCVSYALQGDGRYHDEVSVRVEVGNSTAREARYTITVDLEVSHPRPADAASAQVTVVGSVAARASAELGHKVLTADPVKQCRVTHVGRN